MLFHEIYGSYYAAVAAILADAVKGPVTDARIREIVRERCFGESALTVPAALTDGTWPLLTSDRRTPIRHAPTMPLTLLEKRWMKTLLSDPRIRLFDPPAVGLEDVEPLYDPADLVYYDRYTDGDDYDDPKYVANFRAVLTAIREKRRMRIRFKSSRGIRNSRLCIPYRIEYSAKDDKFRVLATAEHNEWTINVSRITACQLLEPYSAEECRPRPMKKETLVLLVTDRRNALERVMLDFSHLEKETERIDETHYRLSLRYEREDETEILIRVLAYGPLLRVLSPSDFAEKLRERLLKQQKLRT